MARSGREQMGNKNNKSLKKRKLTDREGSRERETES